MSKMYLRIPVHMHATIKSNHSKCSIRFSFANLYVGVIRRHKKFNHNKVADLAEEQTELCMLPYRIDTFNTLHYATPGWC